MNKNIKRNKYYVDEQTNTVTFKTRSACGTAVSKFVADVDDLDILACTTWNKTTGANNKGVLIYGSNGESILQTIGGKYVYATNGRKVFLARINQNTLNYCKTNLICNNKESNMMFGKLSRTKPSQNKSTKFLHTEYTPVHGGVYVASISTKLKGVLAKKVTRSFSVSKYSHAKERTIYAAYLFEKLAYGDNFPNTEYNRKLDVIKTLSTEDIEFVNEMVAPKLEKVYTILKELASDKPAESNEPLIDYEIGRSKDAVFEQIKQTPLKDDTLETADVDDELFAERFKRIEIPERNKLAIQQALAEMKQKPSLFQRIKNWFAN